MSDGPHHIDAERDAREIQRERLLVLARLLKASLDRANPTLGRPSGGISSADEEALRREIEGLV